MNKKKTNKPDIAKLAVIGASLAGIAAVSYFLFGPKGKKHQQQVRAWAIKMKGDVIEKLENAREITEPIYREIIDTVTKEYKRGKKASQPEIEALADDLRKHWKSISKMAIAAKQEATKEAFRVIKTVKKIKK